jgi:hypothetical protein
MNSVAGPSRATRRTRALHATNDRGERYEATFHPGTLRPLKVEIEGD